MDDREKQTLSSAENRFCQRLAKRVAKQIDTRGDFYVGPMKYKDEITGEDVFELYLCEAPYEVKGGCHDGRRFVYGMMFDPDHIRAVFDIPCHTTVMTIYQPHSNCSCPGTVPYLSFEGYVKGRAVILNIHPTPFPDAVPVAVTEYEQLPADLPKP